MAQVDAGVYGGGPLYSDAAVIDQLRASGMRTVVAWSVHINACGDLIFNDPTIVADGKYVGEPEWPARMSSLKQAPSGVQRLLFSVGAGGTCDFSHIQKLITEGGTGPESILYRNFSALREAIPEIDGIDFDDEELYDEDTTCEFAEMLHRIGYTVTFCPYTENEFWIDCLARLNIATPGLVSGFNLQCYAGGTGNEPGPWIEKVAKKMGPSFDAKTFVWPGLWARHGQGCEEGECPEEIASTLTGWEPSGIDGAWIWLLDEVLQCESSGACSGPMTVAAYADAIVKALT